MANQCRDRTVVLATLRARQLMGSSRMGTGDRLGLIAQMLEIDREASDPQLAGKNSRRRVDKCGTGRRLVPR